MHIGEYIGNPSKFVEGKNVQGLVTSNHCVGIEVEIENVRYEFSSDGPMSPNNSYFIGCDNNGSLPYLHEHWYIVRDNSLRNGVEFIFNGPKKGPAIIKSLSDLKKFFRVFRREGRPVRASDRCSIHVHLDVRDLDEIELNRLIMIYVLVERLLFAYVSPSRLKNNYCRPVTDSSFKHILNSINTKANPSEFNDAISVIRSNCDKYSALNLLPIQSYGTVEFRHHQGTDDMDEVLDWVNILLCIKLAAAYSPTEILKAYKYQGVNGLISMIFEGSVLANEHFLNNPEVPSLIRKGMNDYLEIIHFNELKEKTNSKPSATLSFDLLKLFANKNKIFEEEKDKVKVTRKRDNKYPDLNSDILQNIAQTVFQQPPFPSINPPPPPSITPAQMINGVEQDTDFTIAMQTELEDLEEAE
jgi:hypothetical protein